MTATVQRMFAVWFTKLDRWIVPSAAIRDRPLPTGWRIAKVGSLVRQISDRVKVTADVEYKMVGVKWYGEGTFHRETVRGDSLSATYVTPVVLGAFIYNRLFAWKASFAVVPTEHEGCFVSSEFPQFVADTGQVLPEYLLRWFTSPSTLKQVNASSVGSEAVSRNRFKEEAFLGLEIPLPPLATQQAILLEWQKARQAIAAAEERARKIETEIETVLYKDLGTPVPQPGTARAKVMPLLWSELDRWSFNYLWRVRNGLLGFQKARFPIVPMSQCIADTRNGFCIKPVAGPTPHKMLKLNALNPRGLDLNATKYIRVAEKTANQFHIRAGDLLMCRSVGSYEHIAKCAVVRNDDPSVLYPDIIIRVRFNESVLPDFVREVVQSSVGRSHFLSNARTAVGMWKIGAEDIRNFPLPLPPLAIQRRIMDKIAAGRARIARERETAQTLARQIGADMEAYLLGTKTVGAASQRASA